MKLDPSKEVLERASSLFRTTSLIYNRIIFTEITARAEAEVIKKIRQIIMCDCTPGQYYEQKIDITSVNVNIGFKSITVISCGNCNKWFGSPGSMDTDLGRRDPHYRSLKKHKDYRVVSSNDISENEVYRQALEHNKEYNDNH
ncbi:hypothetical protein [Paenibacillus sp. OV219]|uniref:hypothetical protein n=1 Tax=Paenibacillus sp. OV219 TaxID=1884377 RepID=UPI0008AED559|nr:hypothetical protein [Paenibacillus sp. OV219]SEM80988.1 hypothetical protein SAMN05518847_101861 [Paenibacillus sp. OV219]